MTTGSQPKTSPTTTIPVPTTPRRKTKTRTRKLRNAQLTHERNQLGIKLGAGHRHTPQKGTNLRGIKARHLHIPMLTFQEWVRKEHPELVNELKVFGHEIDLKKAAHAAIMGASLLGGSMLPPHQLAHGDEPLPFTQHIQTQGTFDPSFGPQPPHSQSRQPTPMQVWKYQFRWVQEQEAHMRRGRRPSPDYVAFAQHYNNQFPKAPAN